MELLPHEMIKKLTRGLWMVVGTVLLANIVQFGYYCFLAPEIAPIASLDLILSTIVAFFGMYTVYVLLRRHYSRRHWPRIPEPKDNEKGAISDYFAEAADEAKEGLLIVRKTTGGQIIVKFASPVILSLLGYEAREIVGRPFDWLVTGESRERIRNWEDQNQLQTKFGGYKLVEAKHKEGEVIPVELSIATIDRDDESFSYVFVRDMRERRMLVKRLEEYTSHLERMVTAKTEELIESERKHRLLMESMDDVILSIDINGRFTYVNPAWDRQIGIAQEDVMGQHITTYVHPDDKQRVLDLVERTMREKIAVTGMEFRHYVTGQGYRHFIANSSLLYDINDKIDGLVIVGRDISQRKEMEEWLAYTERMESVGLIASGLAHDFNNLFQEVISYTGRIRRRTEGDPETKKDVAKVEAIIHRATDFVRQLLSFAAAQDKKQELFDINDNIRDVPKLVTRSMPDNIRIKTDLQSTQLIEGDTNQFDQVILNLLLNARDAMPDGGVITMNSYDIVAEEELPVPIITNGNGRYVVIEATDTGTGIPEDVQAKVFDPFFTTKEVGKGTGLGLSTVYGIVRNHGGVISVESEAGQGTKFTICLPAMPPPEAKPIVKAANGNRTILFAEDTEDILLLSTEVLQDNGFKVITAPNGKRAVELYELSPFEIDVVVMDRIMPELDGLSAAAQMRKINAGAKIILSTGKPLTSEEERVHGSAVSRILPKPYSQEDLIETIESLLV